jgi:tetratricopeptide (TPR) repeat protein
VADTRVDELRRRLERDPGSRLFAQLAEELRKAGDLAEAIRVARSGLAVHPSYPSARLTLGRALLDSGDATSARAELESALSGAPDNILASRYLAQAREQLGDLKGAAEQYQRTLQMAPGDRQVQAALAAVEARRLAPAGPPGDAGPETTPPRRTPPPLPSFAATAELPVGPPREAPPATAPSPPAAPPPPRRPTAAEVGPAVEAAAPEPSSAELPPTLRIRPSMPQEPPRAPGPPPPPAPAVAARPVEAPPPVTPPVDEPRPEVPVAVVALTEATAPPTEADAEASSGTTSPFPTSTLAELYYQQGLVDRAKDVYRQLVELDPGNARAGQRLRDLESPAAADERAARRRALERTIAGLEAMLASVRRR